MEANEALNTVPTEITTGTTVQWEMSLVHPPSDGFTAKINIAGAESEISITATPTSDNESYSFEIAPADTTGFATGVYFYQVVTENEDGDKFLEASGRININALIADAPADPRSVARKIVDAIDALVLRRATTDQQKYVIGNRELERIPLIELRAIRREYAAIVDQENRAARIAAGKSLWPALRLKFVR